MENLKAAQKSLARVTFTEDQRDRSKVAWSSAENFLAVLWDTARNVPSPELTMACRKVEEAVMWHSKAVSNESKVQ